eukprot:3532733-Prymnesium_polylepis.3
MTAWPNLGDSKRQTIVFLSKLASSLWPRSSRPRLMSQGGTSAARNTRRWSAPTSTLHQLGGAASHCRTAPLQLIAHGHGSDDLSWSGFAPCLEEAIHEAVSELGRMTECAAAGSRVAEQLTFLGRRRGPRPGVRDEQGVRPVATAAAGSPERGEVHRELGCGASTVLTEQRARDAALVKAAPFGGCGTLVITSLMT